MTAFVHYADIDVHSCCSLRAELEDSNKVDKVVKFGEYRKIPKESRTGEESATTEIRFMKTISINL